METTILKDQTRLVEPKEKVAKELLKIWNEMKVSAKNWNDAKAASLWTDDGINMPFYGVSQDRKEMLAFIKNIVANNKWEFVEFKPIELFVEDDMAFEFSLFEHNMYPNDGGETINTKMRCITIYKKEDVNNSQYRNSD